MTSTTETEALPIPAATTADCDACGQTGQLSGMTFDGTSWLCGSELAAREAGDLQQFIDDVAACTQRQFAAEARRKAERAQQAAEAAQEDGTEPAPSGPLPYIPGVLEATVAEHERLRNAKWPASPADGAEPVQEAPADQAPADQDAETGPAEPQAAAEDAPEAVTDTTGGENT